MQSRISCAGTWKPSQNDASRGFIPGFSLIFSLITVCFYLGLFGLIVVSYLLSVKNKGIFYLFLPIYVI